MRQGTFQPKPKPASFRAEKAITKSDTESPRGNLATSRHVSTQAQTYQDAFADLLTGLRTYNSAQHDAERGAKCTTPFLLQGAPANAGAPCNTSGPVSRVLRRSSPSFSRFPCGKLPFRRLLLSPQKYSVFFRGPSRQNPSFFLYVTMPPRKARRRCNTSGPVSRVLRRSSPFPSRFPCGKLPFRRLLLSPQKYSVFLRGPLSTEPVFLPLRYNAAAQKRGGIVIRADL